METKSTAESAESSSSPRIQQVKHSILCRICKKPIEAFFAGRGGGKSALEFRCPRHGTLQRGERFLTGYTAVWGGKE